MKGLLDDEAVKRAIRIGACNIYHSCVHNMLYEKSEEMLRGPYKSASFVVQAVCYWQTGRHVGSQKELIEAVSYPERAICETFMHLKNGGTAEFGEMSERLFAWAGKWIELTK